MFHNTLFVMSIKGFLYKHQAATTQPRQPAAVARRRPLPTYLSLSINHLLNQRFERAGYFRRFVAFFFIWIKPGSMPSYLEATSAAMSAGPQRMQLSIGRVSYESVSGACGLIFPCKTVSVW